MRKRLCIALAAFSLATGAGAQAESAADTLTMESIVHDLPEVMVKGSRPIVKAEAGKLSYNMPLLLKQLPADNAFEALTRMPGVSSDGDGITLYGNNVTLIVNGQATTLTQEQMADRLKAMPTGQLARAEVMMSAPPQYHVRGKAINIITKDYAGSNQLSGQITGAWQQSRYGLGYGKGNLYVQRGKLGIDALYSFSDGYSYGNVKHNANHPLGDERIPYSDETWQKALRIAHDYRLGLNYTFSRNHRLDIAYTGKWTKSCSTNHTTGSSISSQHSDIHVYMHNVDVNYALPFGLSLSASYTSYRTPQEQHLLGTIQTEDGQTGDERDITTDSRQTISKWMLAADQNHSLKHGWGLNYGVKAQFTSNDSYQNTLDAQGEPMPDATSCVDINERIWNIHAGLSKRLAHGISLQASLEAEQYHASQWDKWHIYPTLDAMWIVNQNNVLDLSFSSNSTFPSYWSTMNHIYYSSTYSEIWGNPTLKPYSTYELNLMWQYKRLYTLVAFAKWNPDYSIQLPYQPSDRMTVIMKETNFNYSRNFGVQASAMFSAGNWLNGNVFAVGMLTHDKSDSFFDLPFDRKKVLAIMGGTASVKLSQTQDIRLMLNPFFQTKSIQGVYDIDPVFTLNANLRWTSANGKWGIRLNGNNILNGKHRARSRQGNQDYSMKVAQHWASATLAIVYNFGGYKEKQVKAVDTSRMGH